MSKDYSKFLKSQSIGAKITRMPNIIYYNVRFTEKQLLNYLESYRITNPSEFNSSNNIVEITVAIYAKRYFEKQLTTRFQIAFECSEKLNLASLNLNDSTVIETVLKKRDYATLIDFMLVPENNIHQAFAFQIKRFFIQPNGKNIELLLAKKINTYLRTKLSQVIDLIIALDRHSQTNEYTKIDVSIIKNLIVRNGESYNRVFIMFDNGFKKV